MSIIGNKPAIVDENPFVIPIHIPSTRPRAKRPRFAQLSAHLIKYCLESGNLGLLGVVAYLAMNAYNSEWRYNVSGICKTVGLKRHCVSKWVKRLEELNVLKPVKNMGYAKCYSLNMNKYMELFWQESDMSFMEIETPSMAIQSTSMAIETTPDVDSIATNRIEKENVSEKGLIEAEKPFFTNTTTETNQVKQPSPSTASGNSPSAPSVVINKAPAPKLEYRSRAELERHLDEERRLAIERDRNRMRQNAYNNYLVREKMHASQLSYLENKPNIYPSEKVDSLQAALVSLKRTGCFSQERGIWYRAPVIADDRGIALAEKFFEKNPSITVRQVMDVVQQLVDLIEYDDKSTEEWDEYPLEKKCLKLSYFFNNLDEIVTKHDFIGLPITTQYVTDIEQTKKV